MTHKEIEGCRKEKTEILKMREPEKRQRLLDLARKVGASTTNWAIIGGENDATESQLVDNIERSLQTAAMIATCRTASKSWIVAVIAAIISAISVVAAWVAVLK